jgi:hypothetical protein
VNTAQTSEDGAERNRHDHIVQCLLDAEDQTALLVRVSVSVQDSSMTSWPDHQPFGNQKRFWHDPVKRHHSLKSPFVLVRFNHVASRIVNANHSIM